MLFKWGMEKRKAGYQGWEKCTWAHVLLDRRDAEGPSTMSVILTLTVLYDKDMVSVTLTLEYLESSRILGLPRWKEPSVRNSWAQMNKFDRQNKKSLQILSLQIYRLKIIPQGGIWKVVLGHASGLCVGRRGQNCLCIQRKKVLFLLPELAYGTPIKKEEEQGKTCQFLAAASPYAHLGCVWQGKMLMCAAGTLVLE